MLNTIRMETIECEVATRSPFKNILPLKKLKLLFFSFLDCSYKCEHQSSITHYIQESKFADGFIKEISFSPDGRILSSPFRKGVRLLAFNQSCDELCDCVPKSCTQLSVVNTISSHKRSVLTSAFSPITQLLVTGCRGGEVHFHSPKL